MATLLLQAAGAALGSVFGPVGSAIGQAVGALAGASIDRALIGSGSTVTGARLATARIPGADEGTPITRLYGTARIGGTLFWATRFEEEVTSERSGGKAFGGGGGVTTTSYRYFANFAVGLCEGEATAIRRVWADGQALDLSAVEMRLYRGTADQLPDPLIEAKQGTGNAPAYRNMAYVVFERLPLGDFGNRIPVLQFEVVRAIGALEKQIEAVTIIPGASEHGYAPGQVTETTGPGASRILNRNVSYATTDWQASLDELQALCPNLKRVSLVVSWFGTDLRADQCRVVPGVEVASRTDESAPWQVSGVSRGAAHLVTEVNGGPAFGGTPNDAAVMAAIADLKARGLAVTLYPLMLMDIPAGNALADPYGGSQQAAYPWRGRITAMADRAAATRAAVNAFCGTAMPGDFAVAGGAVSYTGAGEGYRRMILHYAHLAALAGGVHSFIIGSEMRGLTRLRDQAGAFPFVEALTALAADVRGIVGGGVKLTYAADWSEYSGFHPDDGSGDQFFNLDPLWASANIDAVGIDNYLPLADWRDDDLLSANPDGARTADDRDAMARAITGGEYFDWFYVSDAARASRTRTAITDGVAGKPWVFRAKDIAGWWSNRHYERRGGAELSSPTGWLPGMKPIWFTELGCPAVERGANQPNVFPDPKSAESALPYFSSGQRSDAMQRRFLEAHYAHWKSGAAPSGMLAASNIAVWTWDARPIPAFPYDTALFADGGNWQTGHWLNGRLGAGTLADVIAAILTDHGFADFDVSAVSGDLTGYVQGDVASARTMIEPLMAAFQIDCRESGGRLVFSSRAKVSNPPRVLDVLADREDRPLWSETRAQESDVAAQATLDYYDEAGDYESAVARSRRMAAGNDRVASGAIAGVLPEVTAAAAAEEILRDARLARRSLKLGVAPYLLELEPGDAVTLPGLAGRFRVARIEDGAARTIEAVEYAPPVGAHAYRESVTRPGRGESAQLFAPVLAFLDLPRLGSKPAESHASAAVLARPWRIVTLSAATGTEGYRPRAVATRPATIGTLASALPPGVSGRVDRANIVDVSLAFGSFASVTEAELLAGANRLAVRAANGVFEIISFETAEEVAANRWHLSYLLRGQFGTVDAMAAGAGVGADVVLLNEAIVSLGLDPSEAGLSLNWRAEAGVSTVGPIAFAGGRRAATPLAPVHLRAQRLGSGDIRLAWTRSGRVDGANWDAYDIPLDEPEERYLLDILDGGGNRLRSAEVTAPAFTYSAADALADFGAPPASIRYRVRQIGWTVASGLPAEAALPL
ncbi:baseplate multidomain protein megatron [Rhizobium sp. C4]|uniref:baseplate multidomain protein megatron n=1 Tax=Rhizobium sp. C4 TaxID=1349800 RepID=UPI001E2AB7C1|nr:glycoside hydrolase/phage tail family protein [Rhizobium sp. C4]MCD2172017.1 glycoside hydrolase/phage tail family protein [Rhizobium sp. C4]